MTTWALIWYITLWDGLGGEVSFGPMKGDCHEQVSTLMIFDPWLVTLCVPQYQSEEWESE